MQSHKISDKFLLAAFLLLLTSLGFAEGYQVLVLGPVGSRSLYHLCRALSEALSQAGHSVTLISSFKPSYRLVNPLAQLLTHYMYTLTVLPTAQRVVEEFFPGLPPLEELYQGSQLTLINGHFALDTPVPLLPNQVEIGTINAREPKPLPEDLAKFVDESGDAGVIYFSLGSIGRSSDMPKMYKDMFLEAFRSLPQRIVWKYEGHDLELPPNVMTKPWLPQQDLLGHSKTRLFISHCGNLGTQEAKYHGVPILAVPLTFDQHRNAARLAKKGCGTVLNWENLSLTNIVDKVDELLRDDSYRTCMRAISTALHDQREGPGERAVRWMEYLIRHRNSTLLKYPGKRLHYLQYVMLDVWAAWAAVFVLWVWLAWTCVRVACRRRRKEKSE